MSNCDHDHVDYTVSGVVVAKILMAVHRFTCTECRTSARFATKVGDDNPG